jgi:hypothetical protein
MVRVNLLKSKVAPKEEFSSLHKAEMVFTAFVALTLILMLFR